MLPPGIDRGQTSEAVLTAGSTSFFKSKLTIMGLMARVGMTQVAMGVLLGEGKPARSFATLITTLMSINAGPPPLQGSAHRFQTKWFAEPRAQNAPHTAAQGVIGSANF
jgi:hypothetical protein